MKAWYSTGIVVTVLLCSAVRFLQFSVVSPILWQNPHTIDVWDEIPEELLGSLAREGLVLPLPLLPNEDVQLPFPLEFPKFPGKGGLPLPFPLLLSKASRGLGF